MNNFLQLPADKRRTIYEQVSLRLGIDDPKAIEKDIWVTGVLQAIYTLPYADKLVFKGGSSLSKIWNLILRFSEDIDLAIDRSVFGLEGGKSSVSCPLKPSDSAPLKHSTMPP